MQKISSSATKIALLLLVITACAGVFIGVVSEDTFKTALFGVLAFYFGQKTSPNKDTELQA